MFLELHGFWVTIWVSIYKNVFFFYFFLLLIFGFVLRPSVYINMNRFWYQQGRPVLISVSKLSLAYFFSINRLNKNSKAKGYNNKMYTIFAQRHSWCSAANCILVWVYDYKTNKGATGLIKKITHCVLKQTND